MAELLPVDERGQIEAEPEDREAFEQALKTRSRLDAKMVCIDHTRTSVRVKPTQAWFPRGSKPSVELSAQRDWTDVLGVVSEDGEEFYCQSDEYITGEHAR